MNTLQQSTQVVPVVSAAQPHMSLMQLGEVLSKSGYFQDARGAAQAIVKVLAGQEMGFGPIASMTGIHIINGKPAVGATLLAAAIKRSERYNYRVKELSDEVCTLIFFERAGDKWEQLGESTFTIADAKRAQVKNLDRFPRNMLFARAISNGAKWYCPDIFNQPVYTPDELGATVDYETGEIIEMPTAQPSGRPAGGNGDKRSLDRGALEARFKQVVAQLNDLGQEIEVEEDWLRNASDDELIAAGKELSSLLATARAEQTTLPIGDVDS